MEDGQSAIRLLLITANVGSAFEAPDEILKVWTQEFLQTVSNLQPQMIALHCQEVGGKNYDNSTKHVQHFVNILMSSTELRFYDRVRIYLDEDYNTPECFTALGNLYFIHESVEICRILDFQQNAFENVVGKEVFLGNIESVATKEKAKFPQEFFPECKWSRKGFLRTRWNINNTVFDLVNIHLFHDASNLIAMETFPSVYCKSRRRALEYTLHRFHSDIYGKAPYFIFGDFNFRPDTDSVVKELTTDLISTCMQSNKNGDLSKVHYTNEEDQLILSIGKKEFTHSDHQTKFFSCKPQWLRPHDKEVDAFSPYLTEFSISFPPSFPFEESVAQAHDYMHTRCPAWCDRVLMSHTAKELILNADSVQYNTLGQDVCMGDHKPVYLEVLLCRNSGTKPIEIQCRSNETNMPEPNSSSSRYVRIKNVDNSIKVFRETTV